MSLARCRAESASWVRPSPVYALLIAIHGSPRWASFTTEFFANFNSPCQSFFASSSRSDFRSAEANIWDNQVS